MSFGAAVCACGLAALSAPAMAQSPPAAAACPRASAITAPQMRGSWRAELEAPAETVTLRLTTNPNHAGSLGGTADRAGVKVQLAGDVEDGEFTLEESRDGVKVTATWVGEILEGSCGREVRGTWEANDERRERPFVLRKAPDS